MSTPNDSPSRDEIESLCREAAEAGDLEMVAICEAALGGDEEAQMTCAHVIESARCAAEDREARS